MSRHNKKSLILQVQEVLQSKLRIGQKKHLDKIDGTTSNYIYSWGTYHAYMQQCCEFAKWCKKAPVRLEVGRKPRTLEECRLYVKDYINNSIVRGLSSYTIKLQVAALAKLYSCRAEEFELKTPSRLRKNIVRSRNAVKRDKHFSVKRNIDLIIFCRCTGLRRAELQQITGADLIYKNGKPYLNITKATKGGRSRISPIVGSEAEVDKVIDLLNKSGSNKVFHKVSSHADIHSYRSEYATRVYNAHRRPVTDFLHERLIVYKNRIIDVYEAQNRSSDYLRYSHLYSTTEIDKRTGKHKMLDGYRDVSSMYFCRDDLAGTIYDRRALFEAAKALGHNRECVVAEHYLR